MPAGPFAFARFAYPPNSLGYCGPADPAALLGAAAEGKDLRAVSSLAARFDGAWPYLQLISSCSGIEDPLDSRVVDAYWIGNSLLERVPPATLVAHLDDRFERRAGRDFSPVAHAALLGGAAHHNFHVFAVYPWLGLLRAGMEGAPLTVLDRCRIRWGTVLSAEGDTVTVRDRSLVLRGRLVVEGPERVEQVRRSVDGIGFAGDLAAGDAVALHWDWVCQRLTSDASRRLEAWTTRMLRAVNALPAPGPAVACDARGS
ncbi:MAG TPA: DUF6390 family protein [Acidimicrobiales bacterium]|nr:DUF6390 family protein [Acidimicrobiales bacterium]